MRYPKIIPLVCILSALFLGIGFVWPRYQSYVRATKNLENKKTFLNNQNEYFRKINEMFKRMEGNVEAVAKINAALPAGVDYSKLVNYFEKTATENGLILNKINIGEPTESQNQSAKKIKETSIDLSLVGPYAAFNNFLIKIEKSSRLFEAEKISFIAPQKETNIFGFELKLKVYSY